MVQPRQQLNKVSSGRFSILWVTVIDAHKGQSIQYKDAKTM